MLFLFLIILEFTASSPIQLLKTGVQSYDELNRFYMIFDQDFHYETSEGQDSIFKFKIMNAAPYTQRLMNHLPMKYFYNSPIEKIDFYHSESPNHIIEIEIKLKYLTPFEIEKKRNRLWIDFPKIHDISE